MIHFDTNFLIAAVAIRCDAKLATVNTTDFNLFQSIWIEVDRRLACQDARSDECDVEARHRDVAESW